MSSTVKSPNQQSNGFVWAVVAIIVAAVAVIGYIIYVNRDTGEVEVNPVPTAMSQTVEDDAFKLVADDDGKRDEATPQVELYEDYLCPHCAELAKADEEELRAAIEAGDIDLKVRTMTFMDRGRADGQSHHFAAAAYAVAEAGDAHLYWNFRQYLMEHQRDVYQKWGDKELANLARSLDAPDSVVDKIAEGAYLDKAREHSEANEARLRDTDEGVSSPRIFVNGKEVPLKADWVTQAKRGA
ncbi:hypothetical protein CATYP_08585 [Corynebacterium atypicum]|uniref:Thioredoxin-like fold domain-containing protein n=1 Tax=Corynebacterium atypicum TaxID=191610 RepID=A0ABM5QP93_9CORY|nr:thioredoxin domain-containing protein [Corynebacterium atypicum]AIG64619.1 hypothetical protein CATYP_08585 [Corynebacterium atypicum]